MAITNLDTIPESGPETTTPQAPEVINRRRFLEYMGRAAATAGLVVIGDKLLGQSDQDGTNQEVPKDENLHVVARDKDGSVIETEPVPMLEDPGAVNRYTPTDAQAEAVVAATRAMPDELAGNQESLLQTGDDLGSHLYRKD